VLLAAVVWWAAGPLVGDTYFHAARAEKLAELDSLDTLESVNEFRDGGLHPGYAFPLLQGADALVARLAGTDAVDVLLYLPAVLVPLALVLAYAAGSAVFGSPAGGLALVAVQVAQVGLSRQDELFEVTGLFETLSQPQAASRLLLAPAVLALAFAFLAEGDRVLLACLVAAALALSAVHPTYTPYVALVLGGFLVARALIVRRREPLLARGAAVLAAVLVPFGLVLAFLFPLAQDTRAVTPRPGEGGGDLPRTFTALGDWIGYSPSALAREGPVVVAGLLALPLAAFAARRAWAAFVLGGSLAVLAVLLAPPLFTVLTDAFSVSQSRRLASFLPVAFAVVGGCVVLSRFRALGVGLAAGASVLLLLLYPGEFVRNFEEGGPEWSVWLAVAGGLAALAFGAVRRPLGPEPGAWTLAAALAFAAPVAVAAVPDVERDRPVSELTPAAADAVRANAEPGDVVFSDEDSAFHAAAFAPVYVNAGPSGNVADTAENRPRARVADARRFFGSASLTDEQRAALLERYGADWVLVDKEGPYPQEFLRTLERVFEDERYALYRVS
jgi:hypothetical protein